MSKKMKYKILFIKKSNLIYDNLYDYSLVNYVNAHTKVKIICPEHGVFEQTPANHMRNSGCSKCDLKKRKEKFLNETKKIHKKLYDYSLVNYVNAHTKVKIICPEHGVFEQTPANHILKTQGCPQCSFIKRRKSIVKFIKEANMKHNDYYVYSKSIFKSVNDKITITCPLHGNFKQTVKSHLEGHGCRKCANKKIRLKTIERIEKNKLNGNQLYPNYNQKACEIFDKMMKNENVYIQHAQNHGEYYIKELGYWVDGYDKENNIVYEFDEKYHEYQKEKDLIREQEIINLLECKFIRINPYGIKKKVNKYEKLKNGIIQI